MDNLITALHFEHPVWHGIVLAVMVGLLFYIAWSPFKRLYANYCIRRLIRKLGHESLDHITIMDGADLPLYIEYLILQNDGLLLLNVKPFRGNIFAADSIEKWTQVIRHRSFKFSNPLHELEVNLQALRGMLPKIQIHGRVAFTQGATFPKGKPDAVCEFEELKSMATKKTAGEIPEKLREAWMKVCQAGEQDKNLRTSVFYEKGDKPRLFFGTLLLIACLIYLAYVSGWLKGII